MNVTSEQAGTEAVRVLGPADIDRLRWTEVPDCAGVRVTEVWRRGDAHDALIAYQPGATTPGPPHPGAEHHIWVVAGSASVAGQRVVTGSYVYVPPDTAHRIDEVGPEGCTLLQVHRPQSTPS